jgi:Ca2+-binding EF-hand superfamily protein
MALMMDFLYNVAQSRKLAENPLDPFRQSLSKDSSTVWSEEERQQMEEEFKRYDYDGDGYIDCKNMVSILADIGTP